MSSEPRPSVTIVIPAYNAAKLLPKVLSAALEAAQGDRILVVDPGSNDDTAQVARSYGVDVLELGHRAGPALARNRGVELIDTDVALFIDSDCVPHADVVERVRDAFAADPELVSVTGSYDDTPPEQNFFSQYMNLRHHFVHQGAKTEGAGFWAGCGAVKTAVFRQIGGFDAEQFPMPMIEDIELGLRLKPLGQMRLDPQLHVTHLKKWTGWGVITTDIFSRAVPWSKVILESGELPNDLNLSWKNRLAAAIAPFALVGPVASVVLALLGLTPAAVLALVPSVASLAMHTDMIRFFARRRGLGFALPAWAFHQVHLTYSATTMAVMSLRHMLLGGKKASAGKAVT